MISALFIIKILHGLFKLCLYTFVFGFEDYYKVRTSPNTVDKTGMDFYLSLSDDWYKAFPIEGEVGDRYLFTYQGKENMKDGMYLHNILSVKKMEE